MNETDPADLSTFAPGLTLVRRRRRFLWGMLLVYVPAIWTTLLLTGSDRAAFKVFVLWVVLTSLAVGAAALARCPRCFNYFHMHGFVPLYLRKCLHCGLHVNADREQRTGSL